jgi:hypothetical protein
LNAGFKPFICLFADVIAECNAGVMALDYFFAASACKFYQTSTG